MSLADYAELRTMVPMSELTTFRIGGPALTVAAPRGLSFVAPLLTAARETGAPVLVLGGGSNLLVADKGFSGTVVAMRPYCADITVEGRIVTAEAGATLAAVAAAARDAGLSGLEFAAGIPGTVGGGLYMNAGAYGGELSGVLLRALLLDADLHEYEADAAGLDMSYRHTALMERGDVVLRASFMLTPASPADISAKMEDLAKRRREKQPLTYPSAGSTFKRPAGDYAARLIDAAGLRGLQVGGAAVSEKHAGFVVNLGEATAADVRALMAQVTKAVYERFGVTLEPEIRMVGF
ncbi:MAG TPA: UDP-N-acetylmuramate dehydrogenase [Candidatus Acidoferrum sp.]|nr:UDP-N-acetylmuramate dehydrogenase [Candidatus Acidoferrum sp.]